MSNLSTMQKNGNGQMAKRVNDPSEAVEEFVILDPRSANGVTAMTAKPRMNAIATISAGYRGEDNLPKRSKAGEIYIHGDAPNLAKELETNGGKFLTVMFPSNNPRDFIQQRFAEYSSSALLSYGDENSVTVIKGNQRVSHEAGTPEYATAIARCKVSVSVYFMLAQWKEGGANMVFQDGLGLYRLRFTSINSLHSILSSVQYIKKMTHGAIAGIPFDLFLRNEEHSDASGKKRNVWIWQAVPRPPHNVILDAQQFRAFAEYGQSQVELLQLTAPQPETIDDAIADADIAAVVDDDVIEAEVTASESTPDPQPETKKAESAAPPLCDARDYQKKYFAIAGQTSFASDEGRKNFVMAMTGGKINSLSKVLSTMTAEQADVLMDELKTYVDQELKRKQQAAAAPTQPATPAAAAPDPLKRHKKKIISQAKELWGEEDYKAKLPSALGQKNWDGLTGKDLDGTIAMLNRMILANAKPPAEASEPPAAAPDLELTSEDEPASHEPAQTPLSAEVRKVREAASMPAIDDDDNPFEDDDFNVNSDGEVIE